MPPKGLLARRPHHPALPVALASSPGRQPDTLIAALSSSTPGEVEQAKASLIARGADAVPTLLRCLDSERDGARLRALSLLALLGDARASGPVISLLRHPDRAVRARAAGALARIAGPSAAAALTRLLEREAATAVRLAAARALVRLVQTGHDEALRTILALTADPAEDARVRTVALDAVPWAAAPGDGAPARELLSRLTSDRAESVARKASRLLAASLRPRLEPWAIDTLIRDLQSDRLAVWRRALSRLGRSGGAIVEPLVEAMRQAPSNRVLAHRVVLALRALSPRQLARLGPHFDQVHDPAPLEALVAVAADSGSRALHARLATLIGRLATGPERDGPGPLDAVRQRAHLALARCGSRLAIEDLRRLLLDRRFPIRPELAQAAALVGTRRELSALLCAHTRCRGVARLALREAVLAVCRRERIRRTERALADLQPAERTAAREIFGGPVRRGGRRTIARIDRLTGPLLT